MAMEPKAGTALASVARALAQAYSSDEIRIPWDATGIVVDLLVTAVTSTPALTLAITEQSGAQWVALLTASSAVATAVNSRYIVMAGIGAASGGVTQVAGFPIMPNGKIKISVTHADTDSATYSVRYYFVQA